MAMVVAMTVTATVAIGYDAGRDRGGGRANVAVAIRALQILINAMLNLAGPWPVSNPIDL